MAEVEEEEKVNYSAKIYYWAKKNRNIGHLSMHLQDGTPDGIYISHWPKSRHFTLSKAPGKPMPTLKIDILCEGREPDEILKIPIEMINVRIIKYWWNPLKQKGPNYHILALNCAQFVKEALLVGGIDKKCLSILCVVKNIINILPSKSITPHNVLMWIKERKEQFELLKQSGYMIHSRIDYLSNKEMIIVAILLLIMIWMYAFSILFVAYLYDYTIGNHKSRDWIIMFMLIMVSLV